MKTSDRSMEYWQSLQMNSSMAASILGEVRTAISSSIRFTTWRGTSRSVTCVTTPNSPYPPIASENSSVFSVRLHTNVSPAWLMILNDSMSLMNGGNFKPRPWMFEESDPPMDTLSIPVCF